MSYKKFRWSNVYESQEEELVTFLQARNITGERIHAEAGVGQVAQRANGDTRIWCAEGSLVLKIGSTNVSLQAGDAIRINGGAAYTVHPGITNCAYYLTS